MEQTATFAHPTPPRLNGKDPREPVPSGGAAERELARLAALARYSVLDTPPEQAFDDLTALAAQVCATPMALVSLVDEHRQWFKARVGLDVCSTSREVAFCDHALDGTEVLVVPDAALDPRFAGNPAVTDDPHIRFYAGAPLITPDGHVLGTLCVLDTVPRLLDAQQLQLLAALARQVVAELEHRRQADALAGEVAEHEVAKAALERTRRVLDGVLEHSDVAVYAKDRDGRYLLANRATQALLDRGDGPVLGRTDFDLFDQQAARDYRRHDQQVVLTGHRHTFEETAPHPDGTEHSYLSTKFPLFDADGQVYAVAGVSTDVTELTAARRALGESELRWRALVEHSPVAVAVYGAADLRFRYVNLAAARIYGFGDPDELLGRSNLDLIPPEDHSGYLLGLAGVLSGQPLLGRGARIVGLDGHRRDVEVNAALVTFAGEPAVQVELRDITARVTADEALRASEERYRALFTSAPVGVAEALPDGTLVAVNPHLCAMLGYRPEELVGQPAATLVDPDDRARQARELAALARGGDCYTSQRNYRRKDGTMLPVLVSTGVVRDRAGAAQRNVGMIVDVSEQATAQQALVDAHTQLADRQRFTNALLDTLDVGIVACDAAGRLTVFNPATRAMHGLDIDGELNPDEMAGRDDLYEADGTTPLVTDRIPLMRALREGSVCNAEIVIHPAGHPATTVLVSGHALRGMDGQVVGAVVAMHDVTVLNQREADLREALEALAEREEFGDAVLETVNAGVLACDPDGTVVLRNATQRRLTGVADGESVSSDQIAARIVVLQTDGTELPPERSPLRRALAGEDLVDLPLQLGPMGEPLHDVLITARQIRHSDGRLLGAVAAFTDVTGERQTQARLREGAAFHDAVLAASPDLIYVTDSGSSHSLVWSSRNLTELLGFTEQQIRDLGDGNVEALVHPEDTDRLRAANLAAQDLADGAVLQVRYRIRNSAGDYRWLARRVTPFARDEAGAVIQILGIARDITETVQVEERLAEAALHDPLTGLPNRTLLTDRLRSSLARSARTGHDVAVLFCDLDGFKHVNDTGGHAAGDAVLTASSERLRSVLRPEDTVARVGGDEFVVLLEPGHDRSQATDVRSDALAVAERIRHALAQPVEVDVDGSQHVVSVSIGLTFAHAGSQAEEVLRDADTAMYRAKNRGKNRYEIFDSDLRADTVERGRVERVMRSALHQTNNDSPNGPAKSDGSTLTIAYQPIVDLDTKRIVAVEALARLSDDQQQPISPELFIPIAEETGLIAPLGRYVMDTATDSLARWHARYPAWRQLGISVNLSARQAGLADLVEQVRTALTRTGLAPGLLTLELTESVLLEAGRSTLSALHELRDIGVQISIDDFGTGYASLRYLAQLPVSSVKVDRSFTAGLPDHRTSCTIVRAVTGLARDLNLGCVVEGIETQEQLLALPAGVLGQGYLLGRPVDEVTFAAYLGANAHDVDRDGIAS